MQNSKGGGISSQFGAATQIMGVRRGTDIIEKATWTLAILLLVFSLLMTPKVGVSSEGTNPNSESVTKRKAAGAVLPQQAPMQQQQQPQQGPPAGEQHGPGDGHNH
jgi:preprotein translocase subunit SecG